MNPRRFPWHILHPKNRQSAAERVSDACQYWLHKSNFRIPTISASTTNDFSVLQLVCSRDLLMSKLSLKSLLAHCSIIPKLIVAHDESLTSSEASTLFCEWPGEIEIYSREQTAKTLEASGDNALAEFCRLHIFGYKLAACVRASAKHRILYSDADVLWFGDCISLMSEYKPFRIAGSTDLGPAIDQTVVELLTPEVASLVLQTPRICAGFAIYNVCLRCHPMIQAIVEKVVLLPEIGRLAEQTIVNALVKSEGREISLLDVQMVIPNHASLMDSFRGLPRFARHYPDVIRPQFWLDAGLAAR